MTDIDGWDPEPDEYREHAEQLRVCSGCANGFHGECRAPGALPEGYDSALYLRCCCPDLVLRGVLVEAGTATSSGGSGPEVLAPQDMKDPVSTGRKQAKRVAPIFEGMTCEWAGLKYAGGGVVPIIGCEGNIISPGGVQGAPGDTGDLHHGPDKNTLNNTPGINLHRICKSCHHAWHATNDEFYAKKRPPANLQYLPLEMPWVPHDPVTRASTEELQVANAGRKQINKKAHNIDEDVDTL